MDSTVCQFVGLIVVAILPGMLNADGNMTETRFMSDEKYYFVVAHNFIASNVWSSRLFCQLNYNGRLAVIQNEEDQFTINAELRLLNTMEKMRNDSSNELWIGGRTNVTSGVLNVTTDVFMDNSNDFLCVVMADRPAENLGMLYNVYPKQCGNTTDGFICETDRVPPFKHLYMESSGKCPGKTKVTNASLYVTQDGCQSLGGEILTAPSVESIVLCQFDICGVNSMEDSNGIVMAGIGKCPGNNAATVYVGPMWGPPCFKLGGKEASISEDGVRYTQPHCQLDACRQSNVPNSFTVTFSSSQSNCSAEDQGGRAALMVNSSENCDDMHAKQKAGSEATAYQSRCWMNLCHITVADCKTTIQGKDYTGKLSVTVSGKTCQRWDSRVPHDHGNNNPDWFPDTTVADAANYCRNPADWSEGPFCYTTDPDTAWEICDIPFCEGHQETLPDYNIGKTRYIYVPGRHDNPTAFCAKAYGASPAVIKGDWEIQSLSRWLTHLNMNEQMIKREVWVGGRAPVGTATGMVYTDYGNVARDGKEGPCLLLSNWDVASRTYNGSIFQQYTDSCRSFYDTFICEVTETRIEHYEVYGGVPQMGVHESDACINSCQENCLAAGYDSLEESCWHYQVDAPSPGRPKWNFLYVQKAQSACHNYLILMDQNVVMNASSLKSDEDQKVLSADQAKITTKTLTTEEGISPGAWIPDRFDNQQWVQAQFSQAWMVYGVKVMGMEGVEGTMIKTFKIQSSSYPDCRNWTGNAKVYSGGNANAESVTIIFDRAVMAQCVRLIPLTWHSMIAIRFDVIGCTERTNVALTAKVLPDKGVENVPTWRIVDGFTSPLSTCVLTTKIHNPSLTVTLPQYYDVEEVVLYSTKQCCDGELREVSVKVSPTPPGSSFTRADECGYISAPVLGSHVQRVTCSPRKTGKYVQIQKNGLDSQIGLCEVKVYGFKSLLQNVALKKRAYQSDTYSSAVASRAVDGNYNQNYNQQSCSATLSTKESQWWMVDLGNRYTVKHVVIYTRSEGSANTRNLAIYVSETNKEEELVDKSNLCATQEQLVPRGTKLHKTCTTPMNGRYVRIVMNAKSNLYLCEVEVLAEPVKIKTYSGNAENAFCHLPFTYKNNTYYSCISNDRDGRFWCATTPNYDTDKTWGYCIDVSLWGGRSQAEGLVVVRGANKEFTWGTVCDDDWDDTDAKIVCNLMGYKDGKAVFPPFFATGPGDVAIGNVKCQGNETSIMGCGYQSKPNHCTHYEDAAVVCDNHDIFPSFGYPAAKRQQIDQLPEGIFILPDNQEITVPGKVVAWKFYSVKTDANSQLSLQIWRRMYDVQGKRFLLVGAVDVSNALVDDGEVNIADPQLIHVQSGDLIGFSFSRGNPIPYDNTFHCGHHGSLAFKQNTSVPIGGITSFSDKEDAQLNCRLYSLYVKIEVQAIQSLNEFLFEGKLYRVYTVPNTKESAGVLCKNKFGTASHALHLDSQSEYVFVKNFLQNMALKGEVWINNTLEDLSQIAGDDWAPCQPEEGKVCLMMSNVNKDGKFKWYTSSCMDKHNFICETDSTDTATGASSNAVTKSSATSSVPSATRKPKTPQKVVQGKTPAHRTAIIIGILVPALVIGIVIIVVVVIIKYKRDGRKLFDYPLITQEASSVDGATDDHMSVTSEPSKGSVTLHKNNNDI